MNKDIRKLLIEKVGTELNKNNFYLANSTNKYLIYHRKNNSCIEIIQMAKDKYETSIIVTVSMVIMNAPNEISNINLPIFSEFSDGDYKKISVDDCYKRYILRGNFGNSFHYGDVYLALGHGIIGISPQSKKPVGIKLMSFKSTTYDDICNLIIRRLPKAYHWLEKIKEQTT